MTPAPIQRGKDDPRCPVDASILFRKALKLYPPPAHPPNKPRPSFPLSALSAVNSPLPLALEKWWGVPPMPEINPKNGHGGRGPLLLRRHPRPDFEGLNKRMKDDTVTSFEELFA